VASYGVNRQPLQAEENELLLSKQLVGAAW